LANEKGQTFPIIGINVLIDAGANTVGVKIVGENLIISTNAVIVCEKNMSLAGCRLVVFIPLFGEKDDFL
jgi:serine acetyltransferase